jgi:hypothetical protein
VPSVFEWYAVRRPSLRATPVTPSKLEKRHVLVSEACLSFARVYNPHNFELLPRPLSPLRLDD